MGKLTHMSLDVSPRTVPSFYPNSQSDGNVGSGDEKFEGLADNLPSIAESITKGKFIDENEDEEL